MPRIQSEFTCSACGVFNPECGFYANDKLHRGHISICASCHTQRTVESRRMKNSAEPKIDGRKNRPKMSDEEKLASQRRRSRKNYYKNIEKSREYSRIQAKAYIAKFPERKRESRLREKYGLTLEKWEEMFESQGRKCAICRTDNPGAVGWNTDHCHDSGKVRFILCCHCNRGLGAFRDNPELMRRAAQMIEDIDK